MAENSKIEWTDHSFNPWIGCTKVSAGCANCYAETLMDKRMGKVQWGPQGTRVRTSAANTAHLPRLRHLFDVPIDELPPAAETPTPKRQHSGRRRAGRKPDVREAIIRALRSAPGATSSEIATAVGCTREYASTVLFRLADRGEVDRQRDGAVVQWSIK